MRVPGLASGAFECRFDVACGIKVSGKTKENHSRRRATCFHSARCRDVLECIFDLCSARSDGKLLNEGIHV